jgi:hypothetical protein
VIEALVAQWRDEAALLRKRAATVQAEVMESCVADLESRWNEWQLEALTLEQAVTESGFSYSALQKKVASGELENVGDKHKPRVRRRDLPKKGGTSTDNEFADRVILSRVA